MKNEGMILIFFLLFISACSYNPQNQKEGFLITSDNLKISYNYNEVDSDGAVILLHMLNLAKEDWNDFTKELNENGFSTIAIDFRGHGASDLDWESFNEKDFNNMVLDVEAAKRFLDDKGYKNINIIGASIGANMALKFYEKNQKIDRVVLLSPGKNYRGVKLSENIDGNVLVISSKDDEQSYDSSVKVAENVKENFIGFETGGHGTNLLVSHPEIKAKIIEFMKK